jgi:hypothetical protein
MAVIAAVIAWFAQIESPQGFTVYWLAVSLLAISGAYLLARRQAWHERESFWSPPTRRVTQALLPALAAGALSTLLLVFAGPAHSSLAWWLLPIWMLCYGCAVHAAGFFMPRGIKLFGWVFLCTGAATVAYLVLTPKLPALRLAHVFMGVCFGGLHWAYAVYLFFTEQRNNET